MSIIIYVTSRVVGEVKYEEIYDQAIYDMLGAGSTKPTDTAEERAKNIFNRFSKSVLKYISSISIDFV